MTTVKELVEKLAISCPKEIDTEQFVVLIDDQIDLRLIVAHHLSKLGFKKIKQFSNGREAMRWLENCHQEVSVTICDHQMPIMDGFEFVQELEASQELRRGPVAIAIENPSRERIMLATESGLEGVIVKPYALKDIIPKLRATFNKYHNPNNPELLYEAAKAAIRGKDYQTAESIYQGLSHLNADSARPQLGLAQLFLIKEDFEQALAQTQEAEKRNPSYVHTFALRGELYAKTGQLEKAVEAFKQAIRLSPLNAVRYEKCAVILFNLELYSEAITILNVAIQNELSFPSLHHYLSQAYFNVKDYRRAIKHIRSALAFDDHNITYLNQLGICLKEAGQSVDALQAYHAVIKLDPDNKAALYNKAILLKQRNKLNDAIRQLEKLLAKYPDFTEAQAKLDEFRGAAAPSEGEAV